MAKAKTKFTVFVEALNTRGTIHDRLPDLDIGKKGLETTSHSSLRWTVIVNVLTWDTFYQDMANFYHSVKIKERFERTEDYAIGFPSGFSKKWGSIAEEEPVQIGDELGMSD
jgi:hypothetical protein